MECQGRARQESSCSVSVFWSVVFLESLHAEEIGSAGPSVRRLRDFGSAEQCIVYDMEYMEMLDTPKEGSCISKLSLLVDNADSCPMNEMNGHGANNVLAGSRTVVVGC